MIFNLTSNVQSGAKPFRNSYPPEVTYRSPAWWALLEHAAREANRLGLELGMHNCAGYSASGGPWITPERAMQKVVWSETKLTGPARFSATLPPPAADPVHPPFRVDVTQSLRQGKNRLVVAVSNTWANRLIGDEQEPSDIPWGDETNSPWKVPEGETVVVSSPCVRVPIVVRFAWDEAARPNFFNRAGLPAVPFRTDNPLVQPNP